MRTPIQSIGANELQQKVNHFFADRLLLEQALTHRSFDGGNNERLEFLGDSLLSSVISETLYRKYPAADEGLLSRMRAHLVKRETLALVAHQLGLPPLIRMGTGEIKAGGHTRESILADSVEALLAAVYLDSQSYTITSASINHIFAAMIDQLGNIVQFKDSKSLLQEWLQARHLPLPRYQLEKETENPNNPSFTISCQIEQLSAPITASAQNKRKAEQLAACQALAALEKQQEKQQEKARITSKV